MHLGTLVLCGEVAVNAVMASSIKEVELGLELQQWIENGEREKL